VAANSRVTVTVPVVFINHEQSTGLRRGGILNIVRHGIELNCPVDGIPDHLTVSLEGLAIGDSIHISAVALPEGCRPSITGRDFTIASIAASSAVREEAATSAATPPSADQGTA
jgi:large subunit ribosomal protein L25